jgi:DNA-binding NarL/FixJ family response regulator
MADSVRPVDTAATPCRVLICDDQQPFRQLLSTVLGFDSEIEVVGEAENGSDGIRIVEELRPDILLLDVAMPVMDGLEALPHIRTASPNTRVVMLTGLAAASVRERALELGASAFIEKGVDVDALGARIKEVCREGGSG